MPDDSTTYFWCPVDGKVTVFKRPDIEGDPHKLEVVASDVSNLTNARYLIETLVRKDDEREKEARQEVEAYEEYLRGPHEFMKSTLNGPIICECGKPLDDAIHFVPDTKHPYFPQPKSEELIATIPLCECGRTKTDPRHITERDF